MHCARTRPWPSALESRKYIQHLIVLRQSSAALVFMLHFYRKKSHKGSFAWLVFFNACNSMEKSCSATPGAGQVKNTDRKLKIIQVIWILTTITADLRLLDNLHDGVLTWITWMQIKAAIPNVRLSISVWNMKLQVLYVLFFTQIKCSQTFSIKLHWLKITITKNY